MRRFEDRLAALVGLALLGCNGDGPGEARLEAMCDGKPGPDDYYVVEGFVEVGPASSKCPDPGSVSPLRAPTWAPS